MDEYEDVWYTVISQDDIANQYIIDHYNYAGDEYNSFSDCYWLNTDHAELVHREDTTFDINYTSDWFLDS